MSTDLFISVSHSISSNTKRQGRSFSFLDGHKAHCSSLLVLQAAVANNVTFICLPNHCTHALQPLDKCFFGGWGSLKSNFKSAAAVWMKQNPQRKATRYHMGRLIGFARNKAASMGVDVSAVESTGIYPLNNNGVPEYFFSHPHRDSMPGL
jgi:hypothetical protein